MQSILEKETGSPSVTSTSPQWSDLTALIQNHNTTDLTDDDLEDEEDDSYMYRLPGRFSEEGY